ncbi:MAG: hypothetical protein Q9188_004603, partial [Gyalolechia gomerana]
MENTDFHWPLLTTSASSAAPDMQTDGDGESNQPAEFSLVCLFPGCDFLTPSEDVLNNHYSCHFGPTSASADLQLPYTDPSDADETYINDLVSELRADTRSFPDARFFQLVSSPSILQKLLSLNGGRYDVELTQGHDHDDPGLLPPTKRRRIGEDQPPPPPPQATRDRSPSLNREFEEAPAEAALGPPPERQGGQPPIGPVDPAMHGLSDDTPDIGYRPPDNSNTTRPHYDFRFFEEEPPRRSLVGGREGATRDSPESSDPSNERQLGRPVGPQIDHLELAEMADEYQEMLAERLAEGTPSVSSLNSDERARYFQSPDVDITFREPNYQPSPPMEDPGAGGDSVLNTFKTPPKQKEDRKLRSKPGGAASIVGRPLTSPPRPPVPSFWDPSPSPMTVTTSAQAGAGARAISTQRSGNQDNYEAGARETEGEGNQDSTAGERAGGDDERNDGPPDGDRIRDRNSKGSTSSSDSRQSSDSSSDDNDPSKKTPSGVKQAKPRPRDYRTPSVGPTESSLSASGGSSVLPKGTELLRAITSSSSSEGHSSKEGQGGEPKLPGRRADNPTTPDPSSRPKRTPSPPSSSKTPGNSSIRGQHGSSSPPNDDTLQDITGIDWDAEYVDRPRASSNPPTAPSPPPSPTAEQHRPFSRTDDSSPPRLLPHNAFLTTAPRHRRPSRINALITQETRPPTEDTHPTPVFIPGSPPTDTRPFIEQSTRPYLRPQVLVHQDPETPQGDDTQTQEDGGANGGDGPRTPPGPDLRDENDSPRVVMNRRRNPPGAGRGERVVLGEVRVEETEVVTEIATGTSTTNAPQTSASDIRTTANVALAATSSSLSSARSSITWPSTAATSSLSSARSSITSPSSFP